MTQKLDLQLFFITLILLVLGLTTAVREYSGLFFIITLLIVGIPHGSLDHLIYYKNYGPKVNKVLFYV